MDNATLIPADRTAILCDAVRSANIAAINEAIDAGADPNRSDYHGWTPLRYAVRDHSAQIIRLLLERGAKRAP